MRRLDHVNYLAADIPAVTRFLPDVLGAELTEQIVLDDGVPSAVWYHVGDKSYDLVYTADWTGSTGRLHHVAFATDQREDILRAADVMLEAGIHIETGPHKHAIQQTFFLYVWEPGGNRIELCNAGARLVLAPDWRPISWTRAERAKGQAWGLKTIDSFHTHGTPPVNAGADRGRTCPGPPGDRRAGARRLTVAVLGLGEAGGRSPATWPPPGRRCAATTRPCRATRRDGRPAATRTPARAPTWC